MDPSKAVDQAKTLVHLSEQEKLPINVTNLIERYQIFDEVLKKDRQRLPPEQRARLFVRSTKDRHTLAMAASVGSVVAALARATLLDAKDVVAVPAPDRAGSTSGGPSYSFRDNTQDWKAMRRCRTLMSTASSVDELQAGLDKVQLNDSALPCRDEAGRFTGQCTPEEIKRRSQDRFEIVEQPQSVSRPRKIPPGPSKNTGTRGSRKLAKSAESILRDSPFDSDNDSDQSD